VGSSGGAGTSATTHARSLSSAVVFVDTVGPVGASWLVLRAEARRRWRSWVALAALVAITTGFVLAAAAAGRRTASAFPRYLRTYGYDLYTYGEKPLPALAALPEVASIVPVPGPANGAATCACRTPLRANEISVALIAPSVLPHVAKLVSGRFPDQARSDEALASYTLAKDEGLHIGSTVRLPFYAPSETFGNSAPHGPVVTLRIVGFGAAEADFPAVGTPSYTLYGTAALARELNPQTSVYAAYAVRLRHPSDSPRFQRDATALGAVGFGGQEAATSVRDAIHPQAVGWWVLALIVALGGLAVIIQALSRQAQVEADGNRALAAVGMRRRDIALVGMARGALIAAAGAAAGVALAYLLSPIAPVGEARIAEPAAGFAFDGFVLGAGALGVFVLVTLAGIWPAVRYAGARGTSTADLPSRPSRVATGLLALGARPPAVIGVRRALERGRGRTSVPVGNALVGAVVAVAALSGTIVFGASLHRLTSTPRLYGQAFQFWLNGMAQSDVDPAIGALQSTPTVNAITLGTSGTVSIDGKATDAIAAQAVQGSVLVSTVKGRVPSAEDEVALAVKTLRDVGAHIGSTVRVTVPSSNGGEQTSTFRVVGEASFPPDFGVVGLNRGAVFSIDGFVAAQCAPGASDASCRQAARHNLPYVVLVGMKPGPEARRVLAGFAAKYPNSVNFPVTPANLVNFGQAVNFPLILAVPVVLFGLATIVHLLVVTVSRRRREVGLLKSLGFVRRQVASSTAWQATTVAVIGVVVGIPLGLAGGRVVWRAFATNLGVVPSPSVNVWSVVVLGIGVLAAANALAIAPAVAAAAATPGAALRTE